MGVVVPGMTPEVGVRDIWAGVSLNHCLNTLPVICIGDSVFGSVSLNHCPKTLPLLVSATVGSVSLNHFLKTQLSAIFFANVSLNDCLDPQSLLRSVTFVPCFDESPSQPTTAGMFHCWQCVVESLFFFFFFCGRPLYRYWHRQLLSFRMVSFRITASFASATVCKVSINHCLISVCV